MEEAGLSADEPAASILVPSTGGASENTGQVPHRGFGPLVPVRGFVPSPVASLAGVPAADFFLECMAKGGSLPPLSKADKRRGQLVLDYFSAFATPAERELLLPPPPSREDQAPSVRDEGQRRLLGLKFHDLLVEMLRNAFIKASLVVPTGLKKEKKVKMLVGAVESRLDELAKKTKGPFFKADPTVFTAFRGAYEKGKGAPKEDATALAKRARADSGSSVLGAAMPAVPSPPLQMMDSPRDSRAASLMQLNGSN